jgi:HAE1 family hydrophobic/amphiphilic exporter-1
VNLQAEYGYATEQFENLNAKRERWGAGVVFSLPLFDGWRTRGRVAQAWSEMRDVEIALNQLRDNITLEAKAALDLLEAAEEGINATSLNIGQAETALELAETSYQYGVATFLDVTDAQLSLAIARRDHAEALQVYMVAKARVLSAMNEL